MAHMKRLVMPGMWPLPRKVKVYVVTPGPGPHPKMNSMPLQMIVRDYLKFAGNAGEAAKIIKSGKVMVDRKVRKEPKFPAGFMDSVEMQGIKKHYRVDINSKGLYLKPIKAEEAGSKTCRIQGKRAVAGGMVQLSLHDGRNLLVDKGSSKEYSVWDSVVISLPDQKILKTVKLAKGANVIIISGRNRGARGTVKEIRDRKTMLGKGAIIIKADGKEIETLKDYAMAGEA